MGCDIHLFLEKKVKGVWEAIPEKHKLMDSIEWRSYGPWGLLFGIRGSPPKGIRPCFAERGVPNDSAWKSHIEDLNRWYHSPTYITTKDCKKKIKWPDDLIGFGWQEFMTKDFLEMEKEIGAPLRIIIGFDN